MNPEFYLVHFVWHNIFTEDEYLLASFASWGPLSLACPVLICPLLRPLWSVLAHMHMAPFVLTLAVLRI